MHRLIVFLLLNSFASVWAADGPPPSGPMAGFVRYEFNKWLFFPCTAVKSGAKAPTGLPVIDATPGGTLFKAIQQRWQQSTDPLRGVYLEFAGYQENQRATAIELWRALGWVESCKQRPTNVKANARLWAAGNEPFWNFTLDDKQAVFQQSGATAKRFPAARVRTEGPTSIWQTGDSKSGLRAEFISELCTDTMSEAVFGRKVVLTADGKQFTGCGFVR